MRALILCAALSAAAWAAESGSECDRVIARGEARIPEFGGPEWPLRDQGTFRFRYRFFSRRGSDAVSAIEAAGDYVEGIGERKLSWEEGSEVFVFRTGAQGDSLNEPVCVRAIRGEFTLDRLYRMLKPRLVAAGRGK